MGIPVALAKLVSPKSAGREIIPPPGGLSEHQKEIQRYRDCYQGKLFDQDERRIPWGQRYDAVGNEIDRKRWKPVVKPAIGKVMARTQQAYLVGADRFPTISIVSKDAAPFSKLEPLPDVDNPEMAASLAQKRALQTWLDELMYQSRLQQTLEDATLWAIIQKTQPILLRFYEGTPFFTLPDRLWCDWGYQNDNPRCLEWFEEKFFFKRDKKHYFYKRLINDAEWLVWEVEITDETKLNADGELELGEPLEGQSFQHDLGFVPVIIVELPESIFADEMACNIEGYIEYRNNIMAGVSGNMDPQRVLLRKGDGKQKPLRGPDDEGDDETLERGDLWELEGDSITSFANDTEGYKVAQTDIAEAKEDLYQAGRVIVIPEDNEQSGKALALRMAPQFAAAQRNRSELGFSFVETVEKLIDGAHEVGLELAVDAPTTLTDYTVQLDWGQMLPTTPEMIKLELENAKLATGDDTQLLSERTGRRYTMPYFNVEDIAEEEEQIEREKAERMAQQQEMADAAFERASQDDQKKQEEQDDD